MDKNKIADLAINYIEKRGKKKRLRAERAGLWEKCTEGDPPCWFDLADSDWCPVCLESGSMGEKIRKAGEEQGTALRRLMYAVNGRRK